MGMKFRIRRKALGYTIEKLAKISGVCESTIKNTESGKRMPRKATFDLLTKALDLPITYNEHYESLQKKKDFISKENFMLNKSIKKKLSQADKFYLEGKYKEALEIYVSLSNIFIEGMEYLFKHSFMYEGYADLDDDKISKKYTTSGRVYMSKEKYLEKMQQSKSMLLLCDIQANQFILQEIIIE